MFTSNHKVHIMVTNIYKKSIFFLLLAWIISSCAPKYTAHFQSKTHHAERYTVKDVQKDASSDEALVVAENEVTTLPEDIEIKEVVIDKKRIHKVVEKSPERVIRPQNKQELIRHLKENPGATVALNLDRKERKALKKEMKKELREREKSSLMYQQAESKLLFYILAVLLPPLAVGLWRGIGDDFWINLLLTLLLYIPGIIHAIIIISNKPQTAGRY